MPTRKTPPLTSPPPRFSCCSSDGASPGRLSRRPLRPLCAVLIDGCETTLSVSSTCRPYRLSDAEALVSLWALCGLTRPWNDPYRDIERKIAVDADGLLVLEDDGRLIGAVMGGY